MPSVLIVGKCLVKSSTLRIPLASYIRQKFDADHNKSTNPRTDEFLSRRNSRLGLCTRGALCEARLEHCLRHQPIVRAASEAYRIEGKVDYRH